MAETKSMQVNVDFSNFPDLLADLDEMVNEDFTDRSKFIRKLVRQEKARRQKSQIEMPLPAPKSKAKSVAA